MSRRRIFPAAAGQETVCCLLAGLRKPSYASLNEPD